jgi:hypothetical protein
VCRLELFRVCNAVKLQACVRCLMIEIDTEPFIHRRKFLAAVTKPLSFIGHFLVSVGREPIRLAEMLAAIVFCIRLYCARADYLSESR